MRAAAATCLVLVIVAAGAAPAAAQLPATVQALLDNASLRPFVQKVMGISACLSDPGLINFNINDCPSLLRLLDAVGLGNANPTVTCELACVDQFAKLTPKCEGDLRDAFEGDTTTVGRLASEFFATCDDLVSGAAAAAPSPQPALTEPFPPAAPTPAPALEAPKPLPSEPTVSGAVMAKAVLSLVAIVAAAVHLLA